SSIVQIWPAAIVARRSVTVAWIGQSTWPPSNARVISPVSAASIASVTWTLPESVCLPSASVRSTSPPQRPTKLSGGGGRAGESGGGGGGGVPPVGAAAGD